MTAVPDTVVYTVEATTLRRYLVAPAADGELLPLLVGFHGYGENADRNLQALRAIPGVDQWRVASVQELHRFY